MYPRSLPRACTMCLPCHCGLLDECAEDGVLAEQVAVADEECLLARAGEGYVEFAVDEGAVIFEALAGEEVELVLALHGEAVDDDVALAALVAFHGVYGQGGEEVGGEGTGGKAAFYGAAHGGYLVAVGDYDAEGFFGGEWSAGARVKVVDRHCDVGYEFCLG